MSIFSSIRAPKPKRTKFNLSHRWATTGSFGTLMPFLCQDVVPNDKFYMSSEALVETFPMLADIYGEIDVKMEYFFVPNRLLIDDWEDFITGGPEGTSNVVLPRIPFPGNEVDKSHFIGTLWDYFGLPVNIDSSDNVQLDTDWMPLQLPFMAYRKIWNDWYRNENLQDEVSLENNSFDECLKPLRRNWKKDYFTSALPFIQRGPTPLIQVAGENTLLEGTINAEDGRLTGSTPASTYSIVGNSLGPEFSSQVPTIVRITTGGIVSSIEKDPQNPSNSILGDALFRINSWSGDEGIYVVSPGSATGTVQVSPVSASFDGYSEFSGKIEGLSFDINELRRVNAVQLWLERNARAGARYVEQIASHFGVRVPDYRLQRSEFIGGTTVPMRISSILQTNTPSGKPSYTDTLGYEAGKGVTAGIGKRRVYRVPEHGWIIGLLSIVPKAMYNQGLDKKWMRYDRFDYYFPEFAHLGEEPVYNKELYYEDEGNPEEPSTFGYQSRYASYKWCKSVCCGDFRDTMKFYTLYRDFNQMPALNSQFAEINPDYSDLGRVFSVPDNPRPFRIYVNNHIIAKRPMPKYGTPRL